MTEENFNLENKESMIKFEQDQYNGGITNIESQEEAYINAQEGRESSIGLAISGGGVRSATFALGVLQCFAREGWLDKIGYLSTVSGGGYIGSSLTWFLHKSWKVKGEKEGGKVEFNTSEDDFPFGSHRTHKVASDEEAEKGGEYRKALVLQYLRQNIDYLLPGNGLNLFALISVVLRGMFLSLFVTIPLLVLLFIFLNLVGIFGYAEWFKFNFWHISINGAWAICATILIVATLVAAVFSISTYFNSGDKKKSYQERRKYEKYSGYALVLFLIFFVLGTLPGVDCWMSKYDFSGTSLSVLGLITSLLTFWGSSKQGGAISKIDLAKLLQWPAALLLGYGLLLLAYRAADFILEQGFTSTWGWSFGVWFLAALLVGRYVNLNYVSIHRYYRDRLMDTFLPDVDVIVKNGNTGFSGATQADTAPLSTMCSMDNPIGPYHIINTNVVLVESEHKKFRGRGGDNYILSPYYCGSNATGWTTTDSYMENKLTLASAMAISGAAANPDTGVGGEGPTRNPALSLIMMFLNIRLGYWAAHPDPAKNPSYRLEQKQGDEKISTLHYRTLAHPNRPNFFIPQMASTAFFKHVGKLLSKATRKLPEGFRISPEWFGKNENNHFIELTDGGHFENLGAYELIRRKLKKVIILDSAADPDFEFEDLANLIEKVRVDFGVSIKMDLSPLIPNKKSSLSNEKDTASRGHVIGEICYPDGETGELIYVKTTFIKNLSPDLLSYRMRHPEFPDQSTADQFFDEKQFEAYRELGYCIARRLVDDKPEL